MSSQIPMRMSFGWGDGAPVSLRRSRISQHQPDAGKADERNAGAAEVFGTLHLRPAAIDPGDGVLDNFNTLHRITTDANDSTVIRTPSTYLPK